MKQAFVAARLEARGIQGLDLQAHLLGDLGGLLGERRWRHHRSRLVDEVPGLVHVFGDPRVSGLPRLGVGAVVGVGEDREGGLGREEVVFLELVLVEGVGPHERTLHRLA